METTQATYVTLTATDTVSFYNWKGQTRMEIKETKSTTLEVNEINTDELLRSLAYFLRSVASDSNKSECQTRILNDINSTLSDALKVGEITA